MATQKQKTAARKNIKKAQEARRKGTRGDSQGLSTAEQNDLPDSGVRLPEAAQGAANDAAHVRNAIARFNQVEDVSDAERDEAWKRIVRGGQALRRRGEGGQLARAHARRQDPQLNSAADDDPRESAAHAGLRYVSDRGPGITRRRRGTGFRYRRRRTANDPRPRHARPHPLARDPAGLDRRLDLPDRRTATSRPPAATRAAASSTATTRAGARCATRPSTTG